MTDNDMLDNDCDGTVDEEPQNNLVIVTDADDLLGKLAIYEYDKILQSYQEIWSDYDPDIYDFSHNGAIGDLDGDGVNEFVTTRSNYYSGTRQLEVWKNGGIDSWYRSWVLTNTDDFWISAIADIDGDSFNELVVTNEATERLEAYQNVGGDNYALDDVVWDCGELVGYDSIVYIKAAADLNDNGIPEVAVQCREGASTLSGINIVEFNPASQTYNRVATVLPPAIP